MRYIYLQGKVSIELDCHRNTNIVVLHADPLYLQLHYAFVEQANNQSFAIDSIAIDRRRQTISMSANDLEFVSGNMYSLNIW
jgi:hypothetical protein